MRIGERRDPGLTLLFIFLTCGIYYLWWLYTVSREVQEFLGEEDVSPGLELLLCFLIDKQNRVGIKPSPANASSKVTNKVCCL